MDQAKQKIEQVLDHLGLKVQTAEIDAKHMLPTYLVNFLLYFYIKISKLGLSVNIYRELQDGETTPEEQEICAGHESHRGDISSPLECSNAKEQGKEQDCDQKLHMINLDS